MRNIRLELDVPGGPDRAFEVFTGELMSWWPAEYTWSGPRALVQIGMEAGAGGLCYEIGPHGFRCDWGRVLIWDPGRRLVLTWQIGPNREPVPDPERAGEVEVLFKSERIEFEHRGFDRYQPAGEDYRKAMESPEGWPYILDCYVKRLRDGG
jgi:uncharacterized protein YndB with AHSA1/START domain